MTKDIYLTERSMVEKLQKHGIHFIVNTGRDCRAAKENLMRHLFPVIWICYSGACNFYDAMGNGFHIASLPKVLETDLNRFERHGVA